MKFELKEIRRYVPESELIADVASVAERIGKNTLTVQEYSRNGKFHPNTLTDRFKSWFVVLEKAGLEPTKRPFVISEEELFKNLATVWIQLGGQPGSKDIKAPLSKYSRGTYENRYGTWMNALRKFIEYENSDFSEDEILNKEIISNENIGSEKSQRPEKDARNITDRVRFRVFLRDGFRCTACGKSPITHPGTELHCDHILPWSKGGPTKMENLKTLCSQCNLGKGNLVETN